ncbi:retrotransposon protein, putative, ty1-copia subclass [Tanacetum coccineum]
MVPTKKVEKTPYEVWHGQAPKLSYLKVWGCEELFKLDIPTKPDKLEPRSIKCIFVGYPKETMGYSFCYPPENKVFVARNAEFLENSLIAQEASGSLEDLEIIQEEDTHPSLDTSLNHEEDDQEIDEPQSDINPIRRSTRTRRPTDRLCLYVDAEEHELGDLGEPANYKAALLDPESDKWLNAMNVEMQSMRDNEVWELVDLPPNGKTVGHKWLFKKKTDMDGAVHTYKARLVAKGFTQTPGIDYEETFSPVADIRAIRILIAIAAFYDYEIWQMDVKTAFLNGYLNEEVYMEQPEGFVNQKFPNRKFGFSQNHDEPCVYVKASGSYVTFLILYVDDILIMGNNIPMLQDVKSYLGRCFAMKDLGEAAYILGIKIYRDRSKRLIGLCQSAYIEKILKRYYMENSKRGTIPMQEKLKFSKSQGASTPAEKQRMQNILYASAVGSIMYVVRCTRPDVAFAQNMTSRFQHNPGELHWTTVKNISKYLRNTEDMFLVYGGVVDWKSTKQSIFATSSIDAEYIAAFDASKEAVWIRKFISGLGVVPTIEEPINMYCDNTRAIAIAKDHGITKDVANYQYICKPATPPPKWELLEFSSRFRNYYEGDVSVIPTTNEEITLAQILIQIKAAKPKVVTTTATTADRLMAERLQSKEREELTDEEKAKLFMELMEKRRKHFTALFRDTRKENQKLLQAKVADEDAWKKKSRERTAERILKETKKDEGDSNCAYTFATKLPMIIDYKLHKEGMLVHYELIRADGSSKRYSSMIRMLQGIDREDLEALWWIVKSKSIGDTRPEDEFKRVLYGDLRVMFKPDIKK